MNTPAKLTLAGLGLAIAAVLVGRAVLPRGGATQGRALGHRAVATRVLAEQIAGLAPGSKVLIVSNPFTQKPGQPAPVYAFEEAGIQGLKEGWGSKLHLLGVGFPEIGEAASEDPGSLPMDSQTTTPLSFLTAERAWDKLLLEHPEADIFVSLIGVPINLPALEVWRRPKPQLALLLPDLRMIGDQAAVRHALKAGKLLAVVLNKPGAPPETAGTTEHYQVEFSERFLLVTAENVDAMLRIYPRLF